jgi:uncharacterized protein YydD (DUF2326 family)
MIHKITSSLQSFKTVTFSAGFNVILADRTKESTKKDTRNGLGKSTLVDIIHFCLGSRFTKSSSRLAHPALHGISFTLELELFGNKFEVTRRTDDATFVTIVGELKNLPLPHHSSDSSQRLPIVEWNRFLGQYWFAMPVDSPRKFCPTFRSSISYFIRFGKDAFGDPFRHFRLQPVWDIQVNNAFFARSCLGRRQRLATTEGKEKGIGFSQTSCRGGIFRKCMGCPWPIGSGSCSVRRSCKKDCRRSEELQGAVAVPRARISGGSAI